jgi:hypothetical protein
MITVSLQAKVAEQLQDEAILITPVRPKPVQTFKVLGTRQRQRAI